MIINGIIYLCALSKSFLHTASSFLTELGFRKKVFEYDAPLYMLGKSYVLLFTLEQLSGITDPDLFSELKLRYKSKNINLIFIWEDRWQIQSETIKERLKTLQGNFKSIHARKTEVRKVQKRDQITFIEENHFHIFTKAPFSYGLYLEEELVAIATFDRPRKWKREDGIHVSIELVRFACKTGYIVVGGLSKLMKAAALSHNANDIMTFIDADWSDGTGFAKAGFKEISHTGAIAFYVNPKTFERIHLSQYQQEVHSDWIKVWGTGSFKMVKEILDFRY